MDFRYALFLLVSPPPRHSLNSSSSLPPSPSCTLQESHSRVVPPLLASAFPARRTQARNQPEH
eukprot:768131-Hanusia_phi.AAC.5